jgi:hypothetical protein
MSKKLITAALALVALAAFALPASASAANDPDLTCSKGGALCAVGTTIDATNIGTAFFKDGEGKNVLSECSFATIKGTVRENSGTSVRADITTAAFEGTGGVFNGRKECTGTFGNFTVTTNGTDPVGTKIDNEDVANGTPYCLESNAEDAEDQFTIRGGTCSEPARAISFIFDVTGSFGGSNFECTYSRTPALKGTYTTEATGDAILSLAAGENTKFTKTGGGILCPGSGTLQMSFTLEKNGTSEPLYIS